MKLRFTKMQGAGNDFVVLDATREPLDLDATRSCGALADRRFGVGADQILVVERRDRAGRRLPLPHLQRRAATRSSSAATARAASCASCATRA